VVIYVGTTNNTGFEIKLYSKGNYNKEKITKDYKTVVGWSIVSM